MRTALALVLVPLLATAGCTDLVPGADVGTSEVETIPPAPPDVPRRPARLVGMVTDVAVRPIPNATVQLAGTDTSVRTDGDGHYRIDRLPPGPHTAIVTADDHIPASFDIDLEAGETTRLDVVLTLQPGARPYMETLELEGLIACHAAAADGEDGSVGARCPTPDDNERTRFHLPVAADVQRIVLEMAWSARTELARELNLTAATSSGDVLLVQAHGPTVLRAQVGPDRAGTTLEDGGVVQLDVNAHPGAATQGHAGAAVQQPFTLIVTIFYVDPGPPDHSALGT